MYILTADDEKTTSQLGLFICTFISLYIIQMSGLRLLRNSLGFFFFLEESAQTEAAWQNAGKEVGLQIWRIEVSDFFSIVAFNI